MAKLLSIAPTAPRGLTAICRSGQRSARSREVRHKPKLPAGRSAGDERLSRYGVPPGGRGAEGTVPVCGIGCCQLFWQQETPSHQAWSALILSASVSPREWSSPPRMLRKPMARALAALLGVLRRFWWAAASAAAAAVAGALWLTSPSPGLPGRAAPTRQYLNFSAGLR